jgi:drug/metabolite transporter (DMT)-like permease
MKHNKQIIGFGSLLTASFLYGFAGILIRTIGFNLPLFYQSWSRNIIGTMILLFFVWYTRVWKSVNRTSWAWIIARSLIGIFSFYAFFIAFNYLPIGVSYFIYYAGFTIGGYVLGWILFSESITLVKIISLLLSFVGLYAIYSFSFFSAVLLPYIILVFLSGLAGVVWFVFSKKLSSDYHPLQLNFIDFGLTCIFTFVL